MAIELNLEKYQQAGVDWVIDRSHCGLFMDMGLGKTATVLTALKQLIYDLDATSILVIAPKRVVENVWKQEVEKWASLNCLSVSLITGSQKQREAALRQKAFIHVISRDNIAWLCGQYGGLMLPFDTCVIDESSSFKNPKTVRFKALKKVKNSFKRVIILTGTPASNGLIDLWPQIYLLDSGKRLGATITSYRDTYFKPGKRNGEIIFNYTTTKENEKLIHDKISDICMSLSAKDYSDLKDMIINDIMIDFSPELSRAYNEFEESKVLELINSEEPISVLNAVGLTNKLLQFTNGAVYDEDKNVHWVHDLKLDALEEIIEFSGDNNFIVVYNFKSDIPRIMEKFKALKPILLSSDKDVLAWNQKKIKMLLLHPASGGHGLNLQDGGHNLVWFGLNYSLEYYMQTNTRLHRKGAKHPAIIHRIIINNTIDNKVANALAGKTKVQNELLEAIKLIIKKYKK